MNWKANTIRIKRCLFETSKIINNFSRYKREYYTNIQEEKTKTIYTIKRHELKSYFYTNLRCRHQIQDSVLNTQNPSHIIDQINI